MASSLNSIKTIARASRAPSVKPSFTPVFATSTLCFLNAASDCFRRIISLAASSSAMACSVLIPKYSALVFPSFRVLDNHSRRGISPFDWLAALSSIVRFFSLYASFTRSCSDMNRKFCGIDSISPTDTICSN